MIKGSCFVVLLAVALSGCSKQEPTQAFLKSDMRIITGINSKLKGGVETEKLRMRPVDLYDTFDRSVKKKRWKKIHENSWKLIVIGDKDPATNMKSRFEFTLTAVSQFENDVIIKDMSINGKLVNSMDIIENIRLLDSNFSKMR